MRIPLAKLLIFGLLIIATLNVQHFCEQEGHTTSVDISKSKITKTSIYQYKIQTFDNPADVKYEADSISFLGNFSRITLKNKALKKTYIYEGKQLIFKIPSGHFYSHNKSGDAQIQIVHYVKQKTIQNKNQIIILSQMYVISKFQSMVQTTLHIQIHQNLKNKQILKVSKLLKLIENTPMLMYKGVKDFHPCRDDLLCLIRKQFVLISQEDINQLKKKLNLDSQNIQQSEPYALKQIFQINQLQQGQQDQQQPQQKIQRKQNQL